jgi:transposase InsO family protein
MQHDCLTCPGGADALEGNTSCYCNKMSQEVRAYAASCAAYLAAKGSNRLPAGFAKPHALPTTPGTHWTLDFLELPESANGYACLLTLTDRVSKLIVLEPMKHTTALDVASAFVLNVFSWFGDPLSLCSDRGPPFHSAVMHEIFSMLGSTLKVSMAHTPHSHGEIERQHRIINELQRILYQGQFPNILARWDEYAKLIQFMLNTAVVERHGMAGMPPLFFFFGRQPRLPASPDQGSEALDPWNLYCRSKLAYKRPWMWDT